MDYFGLQARLRDLKSIEMQALRQGNQEKAKMLSEKAFELRHMWTRSLSSLPAYSSTEPVIAVNQSEENSCADWQEESDYVTSEGARSKGEDENGAGGPVELGNGSEGEISEVEGVFSSDEDDVADEGDKPGRKGDGELSNAKSYIRMLKGRINSPENEQPMEKEEPNKERRHKGRGKRLCPVPYCKKVVIHIPRHLMQVHKWSHSRSRSAITNFNLRKKYTFKSKESAEAGNRKKRNNGDEETKAYKDYHKKRICPMIGCSACVKRLPAHLKNVHKISPSSDEYKSLLNKALQKGKRPYRVQLIDKRAAGEKLTNFETATLESSEEVSLEESQELEMEQVEELENEEKEIVIDEDGEVVGSASASAEADVESDVDTLPGLIVDFENWLQSPDGGKKDVKTAKQHASQVKRILFVIDIDKKVSSLLDFGLLKEKFVKHAEEKYVAETIKSYLTSLQHFYSFLLSEKPKEITASCELISQLREKMRRWSTSYKRSSLKRKWERREEDRVEAITAEKIEAFEKSQISRDAIILLGKLSGKHSVDIAQQQYTLLRDFLLIQISIDNANRAGVLANMTLREFKRGYKEGDRFVINVMNHKTFHVHGPALIVLTSNLYNWMSIFVQEVRSKVPGVGAGEDQPLFPSFNGTKLQSSQINKAIKSVWKKAGVGGRIHSTLFRKGAWSEEAVQEIRQLFKKEIEQKKVTMECVKEKIKDSQVFRGEDARRVYDKVRAEWRHPVSKNNTLDLPTEKEKLSDKVERLFREESSAGSDIVSPTTALSNNTKALFSEGDVQILHRLFEDMLQNSPISKKVISDRLSSDAKGRSMLQTLSLRQIVNRIKYERRQRRGKQSSC
ncbi:uncharacterized protein [Montipora foliosa]|uniref:uncharacterized protein n=1 Tax=Montipora foliosa TaxID=591990 RepID=UPI0035F1EB77